MSSGRNVIVTGGASGIGLGITEYLASNGNDTSSITLFDIHATSSPSGTSVLKDLKERYPSLKFSYKQCDISQWDQQVMAFNELFEESGGRIDVVVANAGISERPRSSLIAKEEWDDEPKKPNMVTIDVNFVGNIFTIKLAIHYMMRTASKAKRSSSDGLIIVTAPNAGLYPFPLAPIYSASKFGVTGLVQSLGRPLGRECGIRLNPLAPAIVATKYCCRC